MTEKLIFHSSPGSHHCRRVALLIEEAALEIETRFVDVRPPGMGGENEQSTFLALNPNGKVPVLSVGDQAITESNAIMTFLCESFGLDSFLPTDSLDRAVVLAWQFWQAAHLSPTCDALMAENMMKPMLAQQPDGQRVAELNAEFHRWANVIDLRLADSPFLCGETLTNADLSIAGALMYASACEIPLAEHNSLSEWFDRMRGRESWQATQPPAFPN